MQLAPRRLSFCPWSMAPRTLAFSVVQVECCEAHCEGARLRTANVELVNFYSTKECFQSTSANDKLLLNGAETVLTPMFVIFTLKKSYPDNYKQLRKMRLGSFWFLNTF